jgi:hypothetical protein
MTRRRPLTIVLCALALALCGAGAAQAATTRYVATPAHGGNDKSGANTCTVSTSPCATIGQAVSKASSGDTIEIGPGQFPEAVSAPSKALTLIGAGSGTLTAFNSATQTLIDATTTNKVGVTLGDHNFKLEGLRIAGGQHTNNYAALAASGGATPPSLTISHCVLLQETLVPTGIVFSDAVILGDGSGGVNVSMLDSVVDGLTGAVDAAPKGGSLSIDGSLVETAIGGTKLFLDSDAVVSGVKTTIADSSVVGSIGIDDSGATSMSIFRTTIKASAAGVIVGDLNNGPALTLRDSVVTPGGASLIYGILVNAPLGTDTEVPSIYLTFDSILARATPLANAVDVSKAAVGTHVTTYNTILRAIDTSGGSGNDDIASGSQALNWSINYTDYTQTSGIGVPAAGSGTNFDVQPHFVDDTGPNLRLSSASTLFDTGDAAVVNPGETDITGAPRALSHTCGGPPLPDIGAFEAPAPGSCPPPTASLMTPSNGATYTQGQSVSAAYACGAPPAPATLSACAGAVTNGAPVASGGKLDTSTPGTYAFTVTATSNDGSTATATATYTVKPAPPPKPSVGSIKASHKTFADGNKLATIAKKHKKPKPPPVGTTFSFKLNTPATLKLTFAEQLKGRKVKHKCVAQTKHNQHDRSCKLSRSAGTLTLRGHAGTDKISFQGRVSKHKKLAPGTYVLTIAASNASGKSRGRTVTFTIVR